MADGRWLRSALTGRHSLRWRVTAGATAILTVALAVAALSVAGLLRRSLERDEEALLVDRVDEVELQARTGDLPAVLESTGRDVGQVQVVGPGGELVAATRGLATTSRLDVVAAPPPGRQVTDVVNGERIDGRPGERYRVIARTVRAGAGGAPLTIYAVTSLDAAQRAERFLRNGLLLGLPLLVGLGALVTHWVVGRALAPVDVMRAEVDRIEASHLSGRVPVVESDDEISRLGVTLNRMLDRLEESAERQRLFGAAASHELRSPLSAIRTELEVALAYPSRTDWERVAAESLVEVDRLERLSRDLRVLTRTPSEGRRLEPVDLAELVGAEVAKRRAVAAGSGAVAGLMAGSGSGGGAAGKGAPGPAEEPRVVRFLLEVQPATVLADPEAVVQVLRNLLDNAERHARSVVAVRLTVEREQVGGAVLATEAGARSETPAGPITGAASGARRSDPSGPTPVAVLVVSNDGEPVPAAELERIFEPFHRLDEARSLDAGGSGLGLAIARALMVAGGGSLHADDVPTGASFTARFPLAPVPS